MRRVLLAVLALIILLGAAGAVLLGRVDTDFVVRRIAAATAQATGQPLVFASAPHIAFFPPGVRFGAARWGADPAAAKADSEASRAACGPTLTVKGGMAQLEWAALLAGKVVVREVRLDNPVLRLDATAFAARAPHETSLAPAAAPQAAREQPGALPVELDRLVLRQGSVLWTDAAGRTAQIDSINFSLENLRQGQEATLQCDFVFSLSQQAVGGSEPTAVGSGSTAPPEETAAARPAAALTGTLALSAKLSYAPPQLLFRQASVTVTPLGGPLPEKAGPLQLAVEGALLPLDAAGPLLRLDKARLTTPQAHAEARGNVRLTPLAANVDVTVEAAPRALAALWGRTFKPASAGDKDALTAAARIAYAPHVLTINDLKARWDAATLTGTARLTLPDAGPADLKADLRADTLDLKTLPVAAGPAAPQTADGNDKAQSVAAAPAAPPTPQRSTLPGLDLNLAVERLRYEALTLHAVRLALKGSAGRYDIAEAAGMLDTGGTLRATGSVDVPDQRCALKGTAAQVRLGPLLEALGKGTSVDGLADLRLDLRGHCASAAALNSSLTGDGLLEIRRLRPGAAASQPIPGLTGKRALVPETFDLVRAPFTVKNGQLTARPVTVTATDFNARGEARLSLPRQYLEAEAEVRTLGLSVPVVVKGPLQHLSYGVDPRFALDMAVKLPGALLDTGGKAGKAGGEAVKDAGGLLRRLLGR